MNLEAGNAGALSLLSMKHFQTRIKNKKSEVPLIDHQWDSFLHSQSGDIHVKLTDDCKYVIICITAMTCIPPLYL